MTAKKNTLEERLRELNKIEDVCNEQLSVKDRRVPGVLRSRLNYALRVKGENFVSHAVSPALILLTLQCAVKCYVLMFRWTC